MKAVPQYTIRNMPESVDRYLRIRARRTGKSLNQVIIDELSERAGRLVDDNSRSLLDSMSWFIGSGADEEVQQILEKDDVAQKERSIRELHDFKNSSV